MFAIVYAFLGLLLYGIIFIAGVALVVVSLAGLRRGKRRRPMLIAGVVIALIPIALLLGSFLTR